MKTLMSSIPLPGGDAPSGGGNGDSPPSNPPHKPSFASMLTKQPPPNLDLASLPTPFEENGLVSIRISDEAYRRGLERCKSNLVGRLTMAPGCVMPKSHELGLRLRSH